MSHLDPDQIALIALGEPVATPSERAHLDECAQCGGDVDETARVARIARSALDDAGLQRPTAQVWSRIADELELADRPAADRPTSAATAPTRASRSAPRPQRTPAGRSRIIWVLAASLALIAGVSAGVWALAFRTTVTTVAVATLDALPDHPGVSGTADVQADRDGARTLVVTLDGTQSSGGFREVWLIRSDTTALISLGILTGARGAFAIPDDVDLRQYDLVDISAEPLDGNPAHSGDSIVRGTLALT